MDAATSKGSEPLGCPWAVQAGAAGQGVSPGPLEEGRAVLKASLWKKLESERTSPLGAGGEAGLDFEKKSLYGVSAL